MRDRTDAVLAAIDGALMDPELPDGMRWSPDPERADDPGASPFDGRTVPQPQQDYEVTRGLPPGGSMLLAQLRADAAVLRAERVRLIRDEDVPASALAEPLDPGGWMVAGVTDWTPDLRGAVERTDHIVAASPAERAQQRPRLSDHNPRLTPEQAQQVIGDAWTALLNAVAPMVEELGRVFAQVGRAFADVGPTPPPAPADPRAAALAAVRARSTGPPLVGPEASRRPIAGPAPTGPRLAPLRPRQRAPR